MGSIPCEVRIIAFDKVLQRFTKFFNSFDALKGVASTLETFLPLESVCGDRRTEAVDRTQGGEVFKFETFPVQ
jgi:hypothetical protein